MSADPGRGGFRLPAGIRLGRVRVQVADLDRSLAFYRDGIGFREIDRSRSTATLGGDRGPVLLQLDEKPGARPVPRTGRLGIYHFALLLPDRLQLGRFLRHQVRRGARFGAADHAFSEALYLEDPDGITIEVYADRLPEEWSRRPDGGLPLVSDPLDTAGLLDAADENPWDGVPGDAVIGHMHFYVDDLDRAADFYVRGLGLEPRIAIPSALFVAAGGYHHHVGLNTWRAGAPTATIDDARLLDWEIRLNDPDTRDRAGAALEGQGFDVRRDDGGGLRAADPWGIAVRLIA